jgi:hypothetical protein
MSIAGSPRSQVFFSYARVDGAWLLHRLRNAIAELADAQGIEVELWWDKEVEEGRPNIAPGENFLRVIEDAIDGSKFAIFLLSPKAVRLNGTCLKELLHAQARGLAILPVVADSRYSDELAKVRADYEMQRAVREVERIDFVDFSACWPTLPDGSRTEVPPAPDDAEAEHRFQLVWERLRPQVLQGLAGKPFERRELFIVEDAKAYRAQFLPAEGTPLQPRPAAWKKIQNHASAHGGLVVHGVGGIGKTSLLQWVVRDSESRVAACWRCVREIPSTWDVAHFVRAIAIQLFAELPEYRRAIDSRLEIKSLFQRRDAAIDDPGGIFKRAVLVPLGAISEPPPEALYLFVDGLDEAPEFSDDRLTIPELLRICRDDFPPWLRLVATAQSHYVKTEPKLQIWPDLELDPHDASHLADLRSYVGSLFDAPNCWDLLRSAGVSREEATDAVMQTADGNFLVASWLLRTLQQASARAGTAPRTGQADSLEEFDPASFRAMVKDPPPIGDYVVKRLRRRFGNPQDPAWRAASRFLAVLTAARRPLSDAELSALAGVEPKSLQNLKRNLEGILKTVPPDKHGGPFAGVSRTDFFHNGVRKWLRQAGEFQIEEGEGDAGIATAIQSELKRAHSLRVPYLREFGLQHLLVAGRIDLAIDVLDTFIDEEKEEETTLGLQQTIKNVFYALERVRETDVEAILNVDPRRLAKIMRRGCGEIPALYGPARILFDHHRELWPALRQELVDADDLLVRYVLGRALADSYLKAKPRDSRRADLWKEIISCFGAPGEDAAADDADRDADEAMAAYNLRQWARYAWRFLVSQRGIDKEAMAHLAEGMATLSGSPDYNDHMILWECLLEGALTGASLPAKLPLASIDERFRLPRWPYLRLDMLEFAAQCELRGDSAFAWLGGGPELQAEIDVVRARLGEAKSQVDALKATYDRRTVLGLPLQEWQRPAELNRALRRTTNELLSRSYEEIAAYLSPFVLHPCWEVVETAASVLAILLEYRSDLPRLIARWARSPHWQARYAAVDTAFNARGTLVGEEALRDVAALTDDAALQEELQTRQTGEKTFEILVDALHADPVSRVQFIVAEDLFYLFDDYEMMFEGTSEPLPEDYHEHGFRVAAARHAKAIRYWLATAADCTLLDEVFQFVHGIMKGKRSSEEPDSPSRKAMQPLLREWLQGEVSPYLAVQPRWWELDREAWLAKMHAVRDRMA